MIRALGRLWRARSLRERITAATTSLFAIAVASGAVLLIALQQWALIRAIDSSALKAGNEIAVLVNSGRQPTTLLAGTGAGDYLQIVDAANRVESAQPNTDQAVSLVSTEQLAQLRRGERLTIDARARNINDTLRVVGVAAGAASNNGPAGQETVIVATSTARVKQSVHILRNAALIGSPFAVLTMALVTYWIVGQTLRPVAGLRAGAQEITAAGLANQRLPVPDADDEIHRLAVTLNAMLDRLDVATSRQRTFVGDAAHELRSPIASARLQLEIAQRLGPATDWNEVVADVMVDVDRLQRLVDDLLALARSDESGGALTRREPVDLASLVTALLPQYAESRLPITLDIPAHDDEDVYTVSGDPDALRRIVVNLIDNAQRYGATSVTVRLGSLQHPRPTVVVSILDDGPGIAPAERNRVFDRFYRVAASRSRETGGTGLGLPIVRDLVRAHGGSITLADNPTGDRTSDRGPNGGRSSGLTATVSLPARSV